MAAKQTDIRSETLASWLDQKRINSTTVLDALDNLGATEVEDLLDLENDDIESFQPPFLKKLEYVRFKRGIQSLKLSNDQQSLDISSISLPVIASAQTVTTLSSGEDLYRGNHNYQRPPLPPECPGEGCSGVLSSHLGSRKNKYLTGLDGPNFRWIVSCSQCTRKWHACHFLCGHLQKISTMGSSDIIRHEQGRFNRWQKKIKPPCVNNPKSGMLKAKYAQQKSNSKTKAPGEGSQHDSKEYTLSAKNMDGMDTGAITNRNHSNPFTITEMPKSSSSNNLIDPQFDYEFRSMIESLDKDTLNLGTEEADTDRMDEEFLHHSCSNLNMLNSRNDGKEPTNKRIKVSNNTCNKQGDQQIDEICNKMIGECLIEKRIIEDFKLNE